jgi:hypothetical protein
VSICTVKIQDLPSESIQLCGTEPDMSKGDFAREANEQSIPSVKDFLKTLEFPEYCPSHMLGHGAQRRMFDVRRLKVKLV